MVNKVDDIIGVLSDEGQSSAEQGHPDDRGVVPPGVCWRCVRHRVEEGHDLCHGCRAFLLGDAALDPVGAVGPGDHRVAHDDEILLGQSSYVSDLFDPTAQELAPHAAADTWVVLRGGLSDGVAMRVAPSRDGSPPMVLYTPTGMDGTVMATERYVLDESSGPEVWSYELAPGEPRHDAD